MANFKFSPDLFLEVIELEKFRDFLDTDGFRKNILENSVNFGLIKNSRNLAFNNARVERDTDLSSGLKALKISEVKAIDIDGMFLYSSGIMSLPILNEDQWHWVKIKHQYTNKELGKISLSINGDLVGVGTKFTESLRGLPNFPSRIRFENSQFNTLEYDVVEVIDDLHATIAHPAESGTGIATFGIEENLEYSIIGTFTPGVAIPSGNKFPFQYDSLVCELVPETVTNTRPTFSSGREFYIARIKASGSEVIIQDKRTEFWETKGSYQTIEIDRTANPLIGVEYVKWQNLLSAGDKNEIYIAWGMRSNNWTIDASKNIVTLSGSSIGGVLKTADDFVDGDFDGWRLYTANGNYSRIISSVKQGQAINLTLDTLDVDDYSSNGGLTFNGSEYVFVAPNCEEVELQFKADTTNSQENTNQTFCFPVNTLIARCDLEVYKDPSCLYNVQYRYKTHKDYTEFNILPNDPIGYYTEESFNDNGTLKTTEDRVRYPYISGSAGFIQLTLSSNSLHRFKQKSYKGDVIGTQTITSLTGIQLLTLSVTVAKNIQYFTGNLTLNADLYIALDSTDIIEGNSFKIHFNCSKLNLNGNKIYIVRDYGLSTQSIMKTIDVGDVYEMYNQEGGIVFDFRVNSNAIWEGYYQNYNLGQSFEIKMFDGDITQYFDSSLNGKVRGYYGWKIHSIMTGRVPVGYGTNVSDGTTEKTLTIGDVGGEFNHKLTVSELAKHNHEVTVAMSNTGDGDWNLDTIHVNASTNGAVDYSGIQVGTMSNTGDDALHNNMQPYYVVAYIKKQY